MRAYKFLDAEGTTLISATKWPVPTDDGAGPWIEAGAVSPCREGIHACRIADLAYWLHEELWEVELDGEIQESHRKIVGRRGRLLRRLHPWSGGVARELSDWCAWRSRDRAVTVLDDVGESSWAEQLARADSLSEVRRLARQTMDSLGDTTAGGVAAGLALDAAVFAPGEYLAMGPFVAAWAAGHAATHDTGREADFADAFGTERWAQSDWIATRLGLALTP
jgi:hypothetical protein